MNFLPSLLLLFALLLVSPLVDCSFPHRHVSSLNRRLLAVHQKESHLALLNAESKTASNPTLPALHYTQRLDHFNPSETRTFEQLYYVNSTVFQSGLAQPVVLFVLGGEGPISPAYLGGHFIVNEYAERFNALMVVLEHRFYGSTIPLNDTSMDNLFHLSSQQALADAASFREFIQANFSLPQSTKWIVFGGSYSGALSSWARLKYPHLFHASVAYSAPVEARLNFKEYFEVDQQSMGQKCSSVVYEATQTIQHMLTNGSLSTLQTLFNTCSPLSTPDDIIQFVSAISDPIAETIQYSDDNRATNWPDITTMCSQLEVPGDSLQKVAAYVTQWNKQIYGENCMEVDYQTILKTQYLPTGDGRSWTYQTCTEFGYFQTGDSKSQPFSHLITLESFLKLCTDAFGVANMSPNVDWTNDYYGAKNIETSNTFFTGGTVDPWTVLVPSQVSGSSNVVLSVNGTAHCAPFYPPSPSDNPSLVYARSVLDTLMVEWIAPDNF